LFAEVIHNYHPKLLDLHNYVTANSLGQKIYNWETLNRKYAIKLSTQADLNFVVEKVVKKLRFTITPDEIEGVANCKTGYVEKLLYKLRSKLASYQPGSARKAEEPPKRVTSSQYSHDPFHQPKQHVSQAPAVYNASLSFENERMDNQLAGNFGIGNSTEQDMSFLRNSQSNGNMQILLQDKDQTIIELRDTITILELKVKRLEQLVQLKDSKIATLQSR